MDIPGLGNVTKDLESNSYYSAPLPIGVLSGHHCSIQLDGYDDDVNPGDFHVAIANFLSLSPAILTTVEADIFRYYKDSGELGDPEEDVIIDAPNGIWKHIQIGDQLIVSRRKDGDKGIYISLDCSCDWQHEYGLQIVFRNGLAINKVGPYDGHVSNADAYEDESLEAVVYC
jgi:hypothetical protein